MRGGFTLLEALVSIALVGAMFAVAGTAITASQLRVRARAETQATAIAEGALAAALALPSSALTDRTAAPLIGFVEGRGTWEVAAAADAPSSPNALRIATSSPTLVGATAVARVPEGPVADADFSVAIHVPASPPTGWRAGLLFRARDLENGYRYTISASGVAFDRMTGGAAASLYTLGGGIAPDTWVTLEVRGAGTSLTLLKDGVTLTTLTDAAYGSGDLALMADAGLMAAFDDVTVTGDAAVAATFDADAVGTLPDAWATVDPADLAGGAGAITIDRPTADQSLTRIRVDVSWTTQRGDRTVSVTGYAR